MSDAPVYHDGSNNPLWPLSSNGRSVPTTFAFHETEGFEIEIEQKLGFQVARGL